MHLLVMQLQALHSHGELHGWRLEHTPHHLALHLLSSRRHRQTLLLPDLVVLDHQMLESLVLGNLNEYAPNNMRIIY